ncbi:SpoIIE family protein phosphatase [Amphibacillus sediminis]|uniref:SpoIIE family protein phosphatase n=1 Tax=Amphibacillus sediminis TaxID=360185 RepID=UPI00083718AB|nr:SpoIIE family protein phosphatase [Amphibacillus sediminis]
MVETKRVDVSIYQTPKAGNFYCGDSYYYYEDDRYFICALADGLGSGELARESSMAVMNVVKSEPTMDTAELVKESNKVLIGKRGVVLGILKLDYHKKVYTYASIGNIGLITITVDTLKKRMIPISGYLGVYARAMKEEQGQLESGTIFALFSDGVSSHDLSHELFKKRNVIEMTDTFAERLDHNHADDTTLIIIKYH